ncbi:hypothetical protein V9T40_004564 [Parthenolecanium corni]|uniref:Secreted protein n=1 Tax=Parthenolecanium corni TaxID=536013 RepID=A0AAN9TWJ9_9HEMI
MMMDGHHRVPNVLAMVWFALVRHCALTIESRVSILDLERAATRQEENQLGYAMMSHFSASCLNFRLVVSIFSWMSHFSSSCLNFRLVVSIYGWMYQFSSRCHNFRLTSQFSAGCLISRPAVSIFVYFVG